MSRITVSDLNKVSFYQIPKSFFHNIEYITMSSEAKLAYTLLYDLLDLSAKNNWINDDGEVYIKLSREKLMLRLNIRSKTTAAKVMKELIKKGLIEEKRIGVNKCNEIYICTPKELSQIYQDDDLLVLKDEIEENKKQKKGVKASNINGSTKNELPEVQKMDHQKMNFKKSKKWTHTNTKYTNTKFSSSSSIENDLVEISNYFENVFAKKPTPNMIKKLEVLINKTNKEFILAILEYAANHNANTPAYFFTTINKYIEKGIVNVADLETSITSFCEKKGKIIKCKNTNKKKIKVNFTQRDYDYGYLENGLSGIGEPEKILTPEEINNLLNKF